MESNNNQVRFLLIHPFFYPHKGGSEKYAEELYVSLLKEFPDYKVDVLTYNSDIAADFEQYRGMDVYRIPCFTLIKDRFLLPNPFSLINVLFKLSKNRYSFVNTHVRFFDPTWWAWIYAKLIGAKSIFTAHVASHPAYQSKFVEMVGKFVDLTVARFSIERVDYVTSANPATARFLKDKLKIKKDINLVHIGVDTSFFFANERKNRKIILKNGDQINIEDSAVLITYVGRMIWTKGVDLLYGAFKKLSPDEQNKAQLVLAGTGELEQPLIDEVEKDGMKDKVHLTGPLEYSQVRDLVSVSDVFVNPSHHNEGLPNTLLEAGACGCYVIATDNGSTKDVINEQTGALIPQKDEEAILAAIKQAINNPELRENKAKALHHFVTQNLDWRLIAKEYNRILGL